MKLFSFNYPKESPTEQKLAANPLQNRPKLVFLHGMGGSGNLWRPIAANLEDDCDIRALDQRGHGQSQVAPGETRFSPLDFANDVYETLDEMQFHPAWVIGHSMGVRTACGYANLSPSRVLGLVLVDLGLSGEAGGGISDQLAQFLGILPSTFPSRQEAREFLKLHCPDASIAQYLLAVAKSSPTDPTVSFPFDQQALLKTIAAAKNTDARSLLEEFAKTGKPVKILRGKMSQVFSETDYQAEKKFFQNYTNVEFLEIEGAGHGLPFEKRIEFVGLLRRWILKN
jgi:esterase